MVTGIVVLGLFATAMLGLLFGLSSSWRRMRQPRRLLGPWTIGVAALVLLAIPITIAIDVGPALVFGEHQPDEGVASFIVILLQTVIAAGLLARVRWGLYAAAVVGVLSTAFHLIPIPSNLSVEFATIPPGETRAWLLIELWTAVAAATGFVDLLAVAVAVRQLWKTRLQPQRGAKVAT